jgi:hypothetical protein
MQIKIGEDTLENRALSGLRDSEAAISLQQFSVDGFEALRQIAAQGTKSLSSMFGSKENRGSGFLKFGRSEAYREEQARKKSANADDE